MTEYGKPLTAHPTGIPGLVLYDLPVHGDNRGWFKENWQREKMTAAGLPDFGPVQNNISFNDAVGTTRGIHAEPWDKWVSIAAGRVFGAWVDLREGPTFGAVFTAELDPSKAIFVPRGVGNAFQTLAPDTAYSYLVNDHWSPDATYSFLNLADETVAIDWPIPLSEAELSAKDLAHPRLAEVAPVGPKKILVVGANGQLGRALRAAYAAGGAGGAGGAAGESGMPGDATPPAAPPAHVEFAGRDELDLASATVDSLRAARHWRDYDVIINAAAYTGVDAAETPAGRTAAWATNVTGVTALARIATEHAITLVHVSSDYVFDGTLGERVANQDARGGYPENEPFCPLGVYGQTKAAGDAIVATVPRHYIVRTSWVIGDGKNFVRTMASLAERGVDPSVVDDQVGRLTFTDELARGILHLLAAGERDAPYGTYNLTGAGEPQSWADIARDVFELVGAARERVTGVSTEEYFASASGPVAPRPRWSVLDLSKIAATGFTPRDARAQLRTYLA